MSATPAADVVTDTSVSRPSQRRGPQAAGSHLINKQAVLIICCVAQFMVILDLSIVNVALPSIQVGLRFSSADLQWVVDAYAIVFAGFLMLAGRATDIFGQRRSFLVALLVFSLASLAGGLAPTSGVLVFARGFQGLGGAMMAACSLAVITTTFAEGAERHRALALWGAMNGAGGAVGTFLSGVITQEVSWRWVLLINVPIGLITVIAAARYIARHRDRGRSSFDLAGALALTLGLLAQAYGAVNAGTHGWTSAAALIPIIAGTIPLACFPLIERRAKQPLVPPRAFSTRLKLVNVIVLLFSAALFPMWYVSSLYMQQVLSLTPIATGLTFLPMALAIMVCASRAGRLVGHFGVRAVLTGGLVMMAAGMLLFARIGSSGSPIQYVILPGLLTAAGIGLCVVTSTIAAVQGVPHEQAGLASGLVNTSRQVGGGLGLAVLISIATLFTTQRIGHNVTAAVALTEGFRLAYLIGAGLSLAAALASALLLGGHGERVGGRPAGRPRRAWLSAKLMTPPLAVGAIVAAFAGVAFGLPHSHGAPIGSYVTRGTYNYVSAPDLHPPIVTGGATKLGATLPGDILMANFYDLSAPPMVGQSGPLILGPNLQPLWFRPVPTNVVASNLNEQTYDGRPVLSWWQGKLTPTGQIESGEDVVVNQHYQRVATLKAANGWVLTLHEMVIHGHDAWVTANKNVPMDLARYGGVNGGAMIDSAVQEYDLRTGKLLYSWDAADHIRPSDSYAQPPVNGFPWDTYHVNAINMLANGDFLVSMRNTWAVYLVDGRTGAIKWTLGGKHSDFKLPKGEDFEWQHDAQMLNAHTVSIFDDHCCDITGAGVYLPATGPSRGLVLSLNATTHTARIAHVYSHGLTFQSEYMGNVQHMPHGNVFVGWGEVPYMSEFSASGELLYDAILPTPDMTYRAYLKRWTGLPLYPPNGAARERAGSTSVYASWNGATKVARWRVLALGPTGTAPVPVAGAIKSGFETTIAVPAGHTRFELQALDATGHVLGTSRPFATHA